MACAGQSREHAQSVRFHQLPDESFKNKYKIFVQKTFEGTKDNEWTTSANIREVARLTQGQRLIAVVDVLAVDADQRELALLAQLHGVVAVLYNLNNSGYLTTDRVTDEWLERYMMQDGVGIYNTC